MNKTVLNMIAGGLAAASMASASAAVVQTFGSGALVSTATNSATFSANTQLANDYAEGGLLFRFTGSAENNFCGYAGFDCYDSPSEIGEGFDGNYMATAGNNSYVSIRKGDGSDFHRIEFAVGSGFLNLHGYWRTFNDNVLTGSGNFSRNGGGILGLLDVAGFDEVRYFAFSTPNRTAGFSSAAIDSVRVGVPEPGTFALFGLGMLGLACLRRKS